MQQSKEKAVLLRWTAAFMRPFILPISCITVFSFVGNYIGTYEPLFTGKIIDCLTNQDISLFKHLIVLIIVLQVSGLGFSLINSWVQYLLQKNMTMYTESRLFLNMLHIPPASAAAQQGKLLNVFLSDLSALTGIYAQQLPTLFISLCTMTVIGSRLLSISIFFFCLTVVFSVVPVILAHYFGKKQAAVSEVQRKQQDSYTDFIEETISGLYEIKNYTAAHFFRHKFQYMLTEIFRYLKISTCLDMRSQAATFTAHFVTNMALFIIVGYSVLTGKNTVGTIVAALMYAQQFRSLVASCAETYKGMLIALVSAGRVKECFDERRSTTAIAVTQCRQAHKQLRLTDISFSYDETLPVFDRFNALFSYPHLYLIKGENGSGKTTLLNIIAGVTAGTPSGHSEQVQTAQRNRATGSGCICFAGFKSSTVAYVSQTPFIFAATLLDNLTLGKKIAMQQLTAVVEKTQLKKVIDALPDGMQTVLGSGAYILSQGQKQRLALARCLLHGSEVVLFDEVENALDTESTEALVHILAELKAEKLIIMVTHSSRYDSIADNILQL